MRSIAELATLPASDLEVVPWGWSPRTRRLAGTTPQPSDQSVRLGNSRQWSFEWERQLQVALPGAARIERLEDVAAAVKHAASEWGEPVAEQAWVIKANFGMAARERVLGRGPTLPPSHVRWLQRRLQADGAAFFEPWLRRVAEIGIQWDVPPLGAGQPSLLGLTPLLTDRHGGYCGSAFAPGVAVPAEWQQAVNISERTARQLQQHGYFGPLGIDAAIYADSTGRTLARPLQDINARYTMGRLALGFCRLLNVGQCGLWWHGRADATLPAAIREIDLTPSRVGDRPPRHASRVLILPSDQMPATGIRSD